jgi:hypothetical protein
MITMDDNNTYYTFNKINTFKTAPQINMFKIYNPLHIDLINAEIMCTLNYCEKYNNFIIKSLTIVNKPYNQPYNKPYNQQYNKSKGNNYNVGMNKRIINNLHKTVVF